MTSPEGNSEFCFPRISMFPSTSSRETLRFDSKELKVSKLCRGMNSSHHGLACPPFNWFYSLFFTADPDLNQDPASLRYCFYKWYLHYSLQDS